MEVMRMTLADWLAESRGRFERESPLTATKGTVAALNRGLKRRTAAKIGRSIWSRDWDVLVILDACRTDLMADVSDEYECLPEGIPTVWSNAACSIDWINRNLAAHPEKIRDVGYVTANPFTDHDAPDVRSADLTDSDFGELRKLYKSEWGPVNGSPVETVAPTAMTDQAIDTWRHGDVDKMIVHYMQPHQPFRSKPEWEDIGKNLKNLAHEDGMAGACAWQRARNGEIPVDELWEAYRDNLRWVMDDVTERLLTNVDGTVVLSADHGNAMGEWGEWGHPSSAISPAVRRVPWVTVDAVDEQTVTPDVSGAESAVDAATSDQLEALGYQ